MKCEKCGYEDEREFSFCPKCGNKIADNSEINNNEKKGEAAPAPSENGDVSVIDKTLKQLFCEPAKMLCVIFSIITCILGFTYISGMAVSAAPEIAMLCIIAGAVINIIYCFGFIKNDKINNNTLVVGTCLPLIGFLVRIAQLGMYGSFEYFTAYFCYALTMVLILNKLIKGKGNSTVINVLLVIFAAYNLFRFISLNSALLNGFIWKLWLLVHVSYFIGLTGIVKFSDKLDSGFSESLGNYKKQVPSLIICIILLAVFSAIFGAVGMVKTINERNDNKQTVQTDTAVAPEKATETPTATAALTAAPTATSAPSDSKADNAAAEEYQEIAIGSTITTDKYEFTFKGAEFSYDVMPDNPPSYYRHYVADSGQVYLYVKVDVKNLQKQAVRCDEVYSVTADYNDGYTYNGFNIVEDTDGDFTYANITNLDPLQTLGIHTLVDMPDEIASSEEPLFILIQLDNETYKYVVRDSAAQLTE